MSNLAIRAPLPELGNKADYLIHPNVVECKIVWVDPIIVARPLGQRKIHDEAPLPRLPPFWNNAEAAHLEIG